MLRRKFLDEQTIREMREAEREAYEELRQKLWFFDIQSWEERCEMLGITRDEPGAPADGDGRDHSTER